MLMNANKSMLLVVDLQEKLTPHVVDHQELTEYCAWLMELANTLEIPTLVSEHYPKGLGHTLSALKSHVAQENILEKVHFSCASESKCLEAIHGFGRKQIVIVGIEAHVCILQTAIELLEQDLDVFVVADAISSRALSDKQMALGRMRHVGVQIVTKEMVFFEWVHKAGTPQFKELSQRFLK